MNLQQAARTFLDEPNTENENQVINELRMHLNESLTGAFVEYGCLEHMVVHVFHNGTWYQIDPTNGNVEIF